MSSKTPAASAAATASARSRLADRLLRPIFAGSIAALCLVGVVWYRSTVHAPSGDLSFVQSSINGLPFSLEIADTPESRARGVAGKTGLNINEGMLFVFETPDTHCFWMKDVSFSIDILWFDQNMRLIHQKDSVSPATYPTSFCPPDDAAYVVELPAGTAAEHNFQLGDLLTVENR